MAGTYEQALNIAASSTALQPPGGGSDPVVIDRDGVTGNAWMDDGSKRYTHTWDHVKWPPKLDLLWWTDFVDDEGTHFTYVTGANYNWSFFTDNSKPWQVFIQRSDAILKQLATWPYENDEFSPTSVTYGANMITGLTMLLERWIPKFKSWADDIDAPDSDFQGSAAGVLKQRLTEFQNQLQSIDDQLRDPDLAAGLNATAGDMTRVANDLWQAYLTWWYDSNRSNPFVLVAFEFWWAISNATITRKDPAVTGDNYVVTVSTPHGDPMTPQFWTSVEDRAKTHWRDGLSSLDSSAHDFIETLSSSYTSSATALPKVIVSPPPAPTVNGAGGGTGPGAGGGKIPDPSEIPGGGGHLDGTGGSGGNPDFPELLGGAGGPGPGGGGGHFDGSGGSLGPGAGAFLNSLYGSGGPGGVDDGGTKGPGGLRLGGSGFGGTGFGGTGFGNTDRQTVIGPDGEPLTGPGGTPLTVPVGSRIGPDGSVIGPDGTPLTGADGRRLKVPKGSRLTQDGSGFEDLPGQDTVTGPDGRVVTGPGGAPLTVPPGSTIRPDGTVIGPNGKPLTGADGRPLTVPAGSTLVQSGAGGPARGSRGGSLEDLLPTGGKGFGGMGRTVGEGGVGSLTGLRMTGGGMGMSERARAMVDPEGRLELGTGESGGPANRVLEETAQEEQLLGRVATVGGEGGVGGPPMMPPMAGGMGAAGGGGAGRRTWVTEDEETWGTSTGGGPGVIGR